METATHPPSFVVGEGDFFATYTHGYDNLKRFLAYSNSLNTKMKFKVETEEDITFKIVNGVLIQMFLS